MNFTPTLSPTKGKQYNLARSFVGAWDEDGVDGVDDSVVGGNVGGPVGGLGGSLRLEADDGVVQPVLAELAVGGQGAALERLLVRGEGVERLLALDHVVLEDVRVDGGADLRVVLLDGRVGGREERVLAAREVDAGALDGALEHAVRAPEDLRALERLEGVDDAGLHLGGEY